MSVLLLEPQPLADPLPCELEKAARLSEQNNANSAQLAFT
jgi:hypothetical protein